jgi:hypothetical protein
MESAERIEINSSPGLKNPVVSFIKPRIVGSVNAEAWIAIPAIPLLSRLPRMDML